MFCGYAISEELATVFPFISVYKTKEDTRKNVGRCVGEYLNISYLNLDVFIYPISQQEKALEMAEKAALDSVTGDFGLEQGYRLEEIITVEPYHDIEKELIKELSKDYHIGQRDLQDLFEIWQARHEMNDIKEFRLWYLNLQEKGKGR